MSASAFDIAASGMAAHRAEMDLIAENLAHAGLTHAAGAQYRAKTAIFEPDGGDDAFGGALADALGGATADFASIGGAGDGEFALDGADAAPVGVRLAGVSDNTAAQFDADPIEQMVSLVAAGRAYDADVAALQAAKQMALEAIEVDRT